ncbi:ATP-dependent Clp protease ATP-binding subunit [uncultured Anaerococcus sp.]|uniref:ATP-dependent Clp protease ATP-binding subunit n=1 Tax=uncultured Anaerococcus sp. TaxID=293428 RepID=UPI0026154C11|nr:ATP-dependent Clp protease ATP-binding subunit [uncultured Anaerococcus sp.]
MDMSKYSQEAVEMIKSANKIAIRNNNSEVTDLHLLYAILLEDEKLIVDFLEESSVNLQKLKEDCENAIKKLKSLKGVQGLYVSRSYQKILLISEEISRNLFEDSIYTRHILLAILKEGDNSSAKLLGLYDIDYDKFMQFISKRFNESFFDGIAKETLATLDKYGRNMTNEALEGKLDPVIGREEETRSAVRILSRRIKNNPILIGEAGVGKTAIVEGLVQRIVKEDVPDNLKGRVVFALDITALLAGAKYRGDFEDRLKKILEIVRDSEGKIILFIDEIHNIIGTGSSSGAMDTANILKPMLARGEILTIGATTIEEYKKYIEKDGALDRRFQKILVEEASVDTSIAILRGIKSKYEKHHRVKILDTALVDAVKLSKRFLSYRKLPDVAIDVMDEAAALTRMAKDQMPEEIDQLNRKLVQLEMEKIALKEQGDKLSEKRILEKEEQIQKLKESLSKKTELYELEKDRQEQILINEKELESIESEIELIKDEHRIEELDEKIESKKIVDKKIKELTDKKAYYPLNSEVTSDEVKDIVSKLSGMPKVKLQLNKLENLDTIRDKLKMEFVGSDYMIDKIIDTYLISESALFNRNKPIGSFLITGKGAGKNYIAELIAKYIFDGDSSLLRFDMGEYTEKSSVTKLIGAPPGYIGYEAGGLLTEAIRTKPYRVIVFSDIEKANIEIRSLVEQIISEGKLKDNKGRDIDLKNTVIFLTSSTGDESYLEDSVSRIGKIVDYVFYLKDLDKDSVDKLIKINLDKLKEQLSASYISLEYDDEFLDELISYAIKYNMGVHEIKKFIEQEIYLEISKKVLDNKSNQQLKLLLEMKDEDIDMTVMN